MKYACKSRPQEDRTTARTLQRQLGLVKHGMSKRAGVRVRVCECMRSSSRCLDELDDFHRDVQTDRDEPVHVDQVREEAAH